MGDCDGVSGGVDGGDGDSDDGGVVVVGDGGLKTKNIQLFQTLCLKTWTKLKNTFQP